MICLASILFSNNDISSIYNNFRIKTKPTKHIFIKAKKHIQTEALTSNYEILPSIPLDELNLIHAEVIGSKVYKKVKIIKNNFPIEQSIENKKKNIFSQQNIPYKQNIKQRKTSALESNFRINTDERLDRRKVDTKSKYKTKVQDNFRASTWNIYKSKDIEIIE